MIPKENNKKRKPRRRQISKEERQQKSRQRRFRTSINTLFKNFGFTQVTTRDQNLEFNGQRGDIDALFYCENIIVLSEDTILCDGLKDHINKTGIWFNHLSKDRHELVRFLGEQFPELKKGVFDKYEANEVIFRYVYCSKYNAEKRHLDPHKILKYLPQRSIRYFLALSRIIHLSGKFEMFKFLDVSLKEMGIHSAGNRSIHYDAFVLPETPSGFPPGFKVVSFYIDPKSLIERAYVLRKDSWNDSDSLYQRMLMKGKIKSMREYLATRNRAYINNVIVSLPQNANFQRKDEKKVDMSSTTLAENLELVLPEEFDCVGIIDGQHRLFSYHEGNDGYEKKIKKWREKQQLLVTGIIFPRNYSANDKAKFEANLFLEINDKQSRARAALKQSIETIVTPFTSIALAKSVISKMATEGVLSDYLEDHFFSDSGIKTSSIVSYGLRYLVPLDDESSSSSFYKLWKDARKSSMKNDNDLAARCDYVHFCASKLNEFFSAFRACVLPKFWTPKRSDSRALSTTMINGLILCFRKIIQSDGVSNFESYKESLQKLDLDFTPGKFPYKSSGWKALGDYIFNRCFSSED